MGLYVLLPLPCTKGPQAMKFSARTEMKLVPYYTQLKENNITRVMSSTVKLPRRLNKSKYPDDSTYCILEA